MCQFYTSLYQCGHTREEYTACDLASRHPSYRCNETATTYHGTVVQPCGCLEAQRLALITEAARGYQLPHPAASAPYLEMDRVWRSSADDRLSELNRLELLVERKVEVMRIAMERSCLQVTAHRYRASSWRAMEAGDRKALRAIRREREDLAAEAEAREVEVDRAARLRFAKAEFEAELVKAGVVKEGGGPKRGTSDRANGEYMDC